MKQKTHRNHYVPQFYLRFWSHDGKEVLRYDTLAADERVPLWQKRSIKSTACLTDFYTQSKDGSDDDGVEELFADRYESPARPVFHKVSLGQSISPGELSTLIDYVAAQLVRTPAWFQRSNELYANVFDSVAPRVIDDALQQARNLKEGKPPANFPAPRAVDPFPQAPIRTTIDTEEGTIQVDSIVGRQSFLNSSGNALAGKIAATLHSHSWEILEFPESLPLPTSDNPVVLFGRYGDGTSALSSGIGQRGTDIFFPITPHHLLFTEVGRGTEEIAAINIDRALPSIFEAIVCNATRYIFAENRMPWVEKVRPRVVSSEQYEREEQRKRGWGQEQSNIEDGFRR